MLAGRRNAIVRIMEVFPPRSAIVSSSTNRNRNGNNSMSLLSTRSIQDASDATYWKSLYTDKGSINEEGKKDGSSSSQTDAAKVDNKATSSIPNFLKPLAQQAQSEKAQNQAKVHAKASQENKSLGDTQLSSPLANEVTQGATLSQSKEEFNRLIHSHLSSVLSSQTQRIPIQPKKTAENEEIVANRLYNAAEKNIFDRNSNVAKKKGRDNHSQMGKQDSDRLDNQSEQQRRSSEDVMQSVIASTPPARQAQMRQYLNGLEGKVSINSQTSNQVVKYLNSDLRPQDYISDIERNRGKWILDRKVCPICSTGTIVDYKDVAFISQFVSTVTGSILPRRVTGCCAKSQRQLATAIKRARRMALMPYVYRHSLLPNIVELKSLVLEKKRRVFAPPTVQE